MPLRGIHWFTGQASTSSCSSHCIVNTHCMAWIDIPTAAHMHSRPVVPTKAAVWKGLWTQGQVRRYHKALSPAAQASPIVRVAVEPARPTDLAQLEEGLKLLNRADPFVEVTTLDSGEHVIGAAGIA